MRSTFTNTISSTYCAQARTNSRDDFIEVSKLIAKGLDKKVLLKRGNTEVLILGTAGCGKSLIADVMAHVLFDYWDEGCIPFSNKMCFERKPVEASHHPVSLTDHTNGEDIDMIFYSQHRNIEEFKKGIRHTIGDIERKSKSSITFLSGILSLADFQPTGIRIEIRRQRMALSSWKHDWIIDIEDKTLQTPEIRQSLETITQLFQSKAPTRIQKPKH